MPKIYDPTRENRILSEVIVDGYDEEDEMVCWYYYFIDNMTFPFEAHVMLPMRNKEK